LAETSTSLSICFASVSHLQALKTATNLERPVQAVTEDIFIWTVRPHHHHHHLRLAPLQVRSTTGCQQPPEWSVLGQVDCVSPRQPVGVEVVLHRLHSGHPRSSWWSLPIHRRRGSQDLLCVYIIVHSGDVPE